uniref:Uncharacterized protein n=1 Tax=Romanomermis culicivorax TaxID=13658 RepID=A0A915JM15_ROMCU
MSESAHKYRFSSIHPSRILRRLVRIGVRPRMRRLNISDADSGRIMQKFRFRWLDIAVFEGQIYTETSGNG